MQMEKHILNSPGLQGCDVPDIPFSKYLMQRVPGYGDRDFLVEGISGRKITFSETLDQSWRCARSLQRRGLAKGDTVGLYLPNILQFHVPLLATVFCGGTVCLLKHSWKQWELNPLIEMVQPKFLFTVAETASILMEVTRNRTCVKEIFVFGDAEGCSSFTELLAETEGHWDEPHITPAEDSMLYAFTSGTTGLPKAVTLTHWNFVSSVVLSETPETLGISAEDTVLEILNFVHIYGVGILLCCLCFGTRIVYLPQYDVATLQHVVRDYKVTSIPMNPAIAVKLCKDPVVDSSCFRTVRDVLCASAPLVRNTQLLFTEKTGISQIRQLYGLTETTTCVISSSPYDNKMGSVGKIVAGCQGKIIDLKTKEALGPNLNGEICIRGPPVMKQYKDRPEATAEAMDAEGWLHTGDVGYYDEDGFIFIVDRFKEMLKYMSYSVYPAELEGLLLSHPAVSDAGVVGLPDDDAGELPFAFIVKQPGAVVTEKELQEFVAGTVTSYKWLRGGVRFVDSIPKLISGKIIRKELKEKLLKLSATEMREYRKQH